MIPRLNISFPRVQRWQFWRGSIDPPREGEYYLNHSRTALTLILQTILPHGGRVGVMAYNCHTVMNAVHQAKCAIEFIDIRPDFHIDMDDLQQKENRIQVLIVTHLFGIINDVQYIRKQYPHLCIIEDCAHAYGIERIYGNFATFSVGQGKLPSIGDGGILWAEEQWRSCINIVYNQLPNYSHRQNILLFLKLCFFNFLYQESVYAWFTKPLLKRRKKVKNVITHEPLYKMSPCVQRIFSYIKTEVMTQISDRQKNATTLKQILSTDDNINDILIGNNAFMMVAICNSPSTLKKKLAHLGIDSETHFKQWTAWATQFGYQPGSCSQAEVLLQKCLMIPTYSKI